MRDHIYIDMVVDNQIATLNFRRAQFL